MPIVVLTGLLVWFNWFPDPTKLPEPKLLFLNGKSFLTPMRLHPISRAGVGLFDLLFLLRSMGSMADRNVLQLRAQFA